MSQTPVTKTYARPENWNFGIDKTPFEYTSEAAAVAEALKRNAVCFTIFEVTSVEVNGKTLKGEPENFSERRYVGIDRLYTRDEVVKGLKTYPSVIQEFMKMAASAVFIACERPGEFTELQAGEKVFDGKGNLLWPALPAPATQARPKSPGGP